MRITSKTLRDAIESKVEEFIKEFNLTGRQAQELLGEVLNSVVVSNEISAQAENFINSDIYKR